MSDVVLDPKSPLYMDACDPLKAIRFVLSREIDDFYDRLEFLKDWNEGVWWPEYIAWLKKNPSKS